VDERYRNSGSIEAALYGSVDSYATVRSVYFQRREFLISGGVVEESLPDIFDDAAPE
jgi:ABC-type transporter lipoprotein component MlaA